MKYKVSLNVWWEIEAEDEQEAVTLIAEDYFLPGYWADGIKVEPIKEVQHADNI